MCDSAVIVVVIVAWEGVVAQQANDLYDFLINTLPQHGLETDRQCGLNEKYDTVLILQYFCIHK